MINNLIKFIWKASSFDLFVIHLFPNCKLCTLLKRQQELPAYPRRSMSQQKETSSGSWDRWRENPWGLPQEKAFEWGRKKCH